MSEQTEWQKWCEETAQVIAAAGRGEVVQRLILGEWAEKEYGSAFVPGTKYRIKPRTIRIGEYDVPEPIRGALEVGTRYFVTRCHEHSPFTATWCGGAADLDWLKMGVIHLTQEAAELHAKALTSLTAKKD